MSLLPADVLKINNKFTKEFSKFLKKRQYLVDLCVDTVMPYYLDYVKVSLLNSCLEYSEECDLTEKANSYTNNPTTITTSCDGQLEVNLSSTSSSCYQNILIASSNNSNYPEFTLENDSTTQNSKITLYSTGTCAPASSRIIEGGCVTYGSCSAGAEARYSFGLSTGESLPTSPTSYITSMTVYATDSNGIIINTPIYLDLDPLTSPYYNPIGCGACTTLTQSDVEFGNPDWQDNMELLLGNASRVLYAGQQVSLIYFKKYDIPLSSNKQIQVLTLVRHNPAGTRLGLKRANIAFQFKNPTTGVTYNVTGQPNVSVLGYDFFADNLTSIATPCGTLSPTITGQWTRMNVNSSATDFNKLVLNSNFGLDPINLTGATHVNCTTYTLTAVYTTPTNLDYVEWLSPTDVQLSTENSVVVTTSGEYTFKVYLTNGCVITKTITI